MVFTSKFQEIVEILDSKFRASGKLGANAADKGELCECFLKDAIGPMLEGSLKVFRGGRIVDYTGRQSRQLDFVVCSSRAPRVFLDKGLYPVESVAGAIAITATLTPGKLREDLEVLNSIPVENPQLLPASHAFMFNRDLLGEACKHLPTFEEAWSKFCRMWSFKLPYRCIFAFNGGPPDNLLKALNRSIDSGKMPLERMPDHVIINKKVVFHRKQRESFGGLECAPISFPAIEVDPSHLDAAGDHYIFDDISPDLLQFRPIYLLMMSMDVLSHWSDFAKPNYMKYYLGDMEG